MGQCEVCGNQYDNLFEVKFQNNQTSHWFDCFECATHKLAPSCSHCGVKILGHGVQVGDKMFCGAHCARAKGFKDIVDRAQRIMA